MTRRDTEPSDREKKRAALLEAMEVYRDWQRADRGLDAYRAATKVRYITITTDRANARRR